NASAGVNRNLDRFNFLSQHNAVIENAAPVLSNVGDKRAFRQPLQRKTEAALGKAGRAKLAFCIESQRSGINQQAPWSGIECHEAEVQWGRCAERGRGDLSFQSGSRANRKNEPGNIRIRYYDRGAGRAKQGSL